MCHFKGGHLSQVDSRHFIIEKFWFKIPLKADIKTASLTNCNIDNHKETDFIIQERALFIGAIGTSNTLLDSFISLKLVCSRLQDTENDPVSILMSHNSSARVT